jgi:hypothetical protein
VAAGERDAASSSSGVAPSRSRPTSRAAPA